ncbi:MAG TPA: mechanosensitive ion channel domain-containing protein [Thermoanaerobaculia bacterium]|nr:mechanosensitive ion channel domain-containing protein [Thermoanaerobaculia bacterium]
MHPTLALLASLGAFALIVALVTWLQRKSFLVRQLAFPLFLAAAAVAIEVYSLLVPPSAAVDQARSWILLFLGAATVLRLLGLYFFDVHLRARTGFQFPPLLPRVTMAVIYLIAAFVTLRITFPKLGLGGLIATSAVTSLVLGLALQPILSNFFAGLVISVERPFRINDWIKVGDFEGRVVSITWRTTHLRTRENDNLVIPNSKLADERVVNYYYPHPMHLERIKVGASYDAPPYRVRRALLESIAGVPGVLDKPSPEVFLPKFEDSSIGYELRIWLDDVANAPRIASEVRQRIWEVFRKERITMPYPIRTLEIAPRRRRADTGEARPDHPRPARLFVTDGVERGQSLDLNGEPVTVGRSRNCALVLSEPNASKEHLRISWEDGAWVMTDLGSSFGTRVNGRPATRAELSAFDRIGIGDAVIIFETDA